MLYKKQIIQVSILGSSICNLTCSYCYLHNQSKAIQKFYADLNEEVQTGWKTGTYVNNIKQVFEKINADPKLTNRLEIWGGEPLLLTKNLVCSAKELFQLFPNINFLLIPTNWAWNGSEVIPSLIQFIEIADQFSTPRGKDDYKLNFHLQLSIDGMSGKLNADGHHSNLEVYKQNIILFCKLMENKHLQNIQIEFDIHPTASGKTILNEFNNNITNIKTYFSEMQGYANFIREQISLYNLSDCVSCGVMALFPLCAMPEYSTKEEGLQYLAMNKLVDYIWKTNYKDIDNFMEHSYNCFVHAINSSCTIGRNSQCTEAHAGALMILPDGTLSECACSYVQNDLRYLKALQLENNQKDLRISLMRKKYFFNPLTASSKEEEFNDWYHLTGLRDTYSTQINLAMGLCQELALSRQIDFSYALNPDKLLKDLCLSSMPFSCTREQIADTKIPYLGNPGDFRRQLNGLVDFIHAEREAETEYLVEDNMKNG